MKNFLTSLSLKARIAFCTAMVALSPGIAYAQDNIGQQVLSGFEQEMGSVSQGFFRILRIIFIIGGAISLIMVGFNVIQGERDSMKKAGWWIIGLVFCLGGLAVLQRFAG